MSQNQNLELQLRDMLLLINKFKESAEMELDEIKDLLPIQDFELDPKKMLPFIAVDGSQTWLWSPMGINIWLMLNRIGIVHYELHDNQYRLIDKEMVDNVELVSTLKEVVKTQSNIHQRLYAYVLEKAKGREHDVIAGSLMRLIEHKVALNHAKVNENVIIALDGSLVSPFPEDLLTGESTATISELIEVCEENNNILIGVSKDSKTHFFSNYMTDEALLKFATYGESKRYYIKVQKSEEDHTGDIYFVKLHPDASKWFRIDLGTMRDNPKEVFQLVSQYARSQILIGYPFPLTEAHKVAVTIRQFRNIYEQLVFDVGPVCGFSSGEILRGFTDMEGRRKGDFHSALDLISRINR